ncbi:DUF4019 domain-containing protein [Vibrio sp. DW001]|uniref:DUF4019 domain-containing protein n=1 Tax=Vibrio sp. DW001 TaxID=2912315 RepID=UPI0023AF30B4|nr:DUF4019 domain-containing protein [Vibrio sp. DW001]WED25369.1 DUF4019 domain-containing protein [Vibrio sp. DW001]
MKNLLLILSLIISSVVWASPSPGSSASKEWLNIIDAGKYGESWQKADLFFKSQLSQKNGTVLSKKIVHPRVKLLHTQS